MWARAEQRTDHSTLDGATPSPYAQYIFVGDGLPYDEAKHNREKVTSMWPPKL